MESLIKRQSCQLVFDCLQDNVCTPFKGYFTKIEHNINTRNNGCSLKLPKAKLEFGRRSFAFQGPLVYNTLLRHLRNLNSRLLFKSNLKEFFQQYSIIHNSFQSYKSIIFTDFDFWILDFLVLFYFIFLFRFYSLFFSYLWDNYRTLFITVLFIRNDRLSCINIRVIIIISSSSSIEQTFKCRGRREEV